MLKRLAFAYSMLVGLPLLLVLGTLQAGRHIVGPAQVSGDWLVDNPKTWRICDMPFAAPALLNISQSGADFDIALSGRDRTTATGRMEGSRFSMAGNFGGSSNGCRAKAIIRIEGNVVGPPGQRSLVGRVSFSDCASCGLTPFHATRLAAPASDAQ
jgi:hypothetical protein